MKKILYLLLSAVMVVVMMAPMEARAANVNVWTSEGVPEIVSQVSTDNASYSYTTTRVRIPIGFNFSTGESEWYMGHWIGLTNVDFLVNSIFDTDIPSVADWQLVDIKLPDGFNFIITEGAFGSWSIDDGNLLQMNSKFVIRFPADTLAANTDFQFHVVVEYILITRDGVPSFDFIPFVNSASSDQVFCQRDAWENTPNRIIDSIIGFKNQIGNWFQTQWTFGRQWTDDIIDAIVGQSGGGGISSAQDELDDQLNSIEVVEQQLSDQVADKIEVPSVSLNADETGGLRWVITTINSLYLSFNELHVMFASVVFFGIIAVLLFGRRNL